jgi:hypothetical protein
VPGSTCGARGGLEAREAGEASSVISETPASARETGQVALAPSAACLKASSCRPGTFPTVVSAIS